MSVGAVFTKDDLGESPGNAKICFDGDRVARRQGATRGNSGNAVNIEIPMASGTRNPSIATPQCKTVPPKYAKMSFDEFTKEMREKMHEIVQESLGLFRKDPREYHPFYLRIFKYVTIGQLLGYMSSEEDTVITAIWGGFLHFAKANYEAAVHKQVAYTGERSPYATFLLTGKVVIDGKVMTQIRDENERKKQFEELEATAKRMRKEWLLKNGSGDIKEDIREIFRFFQMCKTVTFPADTSIMNDVWSYLLGENTGKSQSEVEQDGEGRDREESCTSTVVKRTITVRVRRSLTTKPSSSPKPSTPAPGAPVARTKKLSSSSFNNLTPATASRIKRRKIQIPASGKKPLLLKTLLQKKRKRLLGLATTSSTGEKQQLELEKLLKSKDKQIITSRISVKRKNRLKKIRKIASDQKCTPSHFSTAKKSSLKRVTKLSASSNRNKVPTSNALKAKAKKAILSTSSKISSLRKKTHIKKLSQSSRSKSKRNSSAARMTKGKRKSESTENVEDDENLDTTKVSKDCDDGRGSQKSASDKTCDICNTVVHEKHRLWRHKMDIHQCSPVEVAASLGISLTAIQQCPYCPIWRIKGMQMSNHVQSEHGDKHHEWMIKRRHYQKLAELIRGKYRRLPINCPVCFQKIRRMEILDEHLKLHHGIVENGDLWRCAACPTITFDTRHVWLTHMERKHGDSVDMEEMLEIAKKLNVKDEELLGPRVSGDPEEEHCSLIDPEGREKCDKCRQFFLPEYLPIHEKANHGSDPPMGQCPVCPKEFIHGLSVWTHYCRAHLKDGDLDDLDPVPPDLRGYASHPQYPPLINKSDPADAEAVEPRYCDECGQAFNSDEILRKHVLSAHGKDKQKEEKCFVCPYCPRQYRTDSILSHHIKRVHDQTMLTICPYCPGLRGSRRGRLGRDLQSTGKLWRHLLDAHSISAADASAYCNVTSINCPACGDNFLAGAQFANHVKAEHAHQSEEILRTHQIIVKKIRGTRTRRPKNYNGAFKTWHKVTGDKDSGECPDCGQLLRVGFNRHRMIVHGVKSEHYFNCLVEGCKATMKCTTAFRRHMRAVHTGPLEQKIVDKKIIKVVEKGLHCTVHMCTLCETYLFYYDQIKAHVVGLHPEILQELVTPVEFTCPYCSEKWGSDELVRNHAEQVHSELCCRCPECDKILLDSKDMKNHFMEGHIKAEGGANVKVKVIEDDGFLKLRDNVKPIYPINLKTYAPDKVARRGVLTKKYEEMLIRCEICGEETLLKFLSRHLATNHKIKEDGEDLLCSVCSKIRERKYLIRKRQKWLIHMHMYHEHEVNMEELVEEACTVRTKVHWSQMKDGNWKRGKGLKEPSSNEGSSEESEEESEYDSGEDKKCVKSKKVPNSRKVVRTSVKKTAARPKSYKKKKKWTDVEDGESECKVGAKKTKSRDNGGSKTRPSQGLQTSTRKSHDEVSGDEADNDFGERKRKTPVATPAVRASTRVRKPAKWKFDSSSDSDDDDHNLNSNAANSSGDDRSRSTVKTARGSSRRYTPSQMGKSSSVRNSIRGNSRMTKNSCTSSTSPNEVERRKRLVIRLERLSKELLERYYAGGKTF